MSASPFFKSVGRGDLREKGRSNSSNIREPIKTRKGKLAGRGKHDARLADFKTSEIARQLCWKFYGGVSKKVRLHDDCYVLGNSNRNAISLCWNMDNLTCNVVFF